ncbi:hypothetical protein BN938_1248 [Mucinivorans hirudinis]|uniref:Uncharacterized protein n=1 Tax=Mucinivorans hirudinis TaxID=1433126 RepID=A0A060R7Q5_9BACT|nr:hypothetical protein BN938_1248 [Mucinivorans hirudinis]
MRICGYDKEAKTRLKIDKNAPSEEYGTNTQLFEHKKDISY